MFLDPIPRMSVAGNAVLTDLYASSPSRKRPTASDASELARVILERDGLRETLASTQKRLERSTALRKRAEQDASAFVKTIHKQRYDLAQATSETDEKLRHAREIARTEKDDLRKQIQTLIHDLAETKNRLKAFRNDAEAYRTASESRVAVTNAKMRDSARTLVKREAECGSLRLELDLERSESAKFKSLVESCESRLQLLEGRIEATETPKEAANDGDDGNDVGASIDSSSSPRPFSRPRSGPEPPLVPIKSVANVFQDVVTKRKRRRVKKSDVSPLFLWVFVASVVLALNLVGGALLKRN